MKRQPSVRQGRRLHGLLCDRADTADRESGVREIDATAAGGARTRRRLCPTGLARAKARALPHDRRGKFNLCKSSPGRSVLPP